MNYELRPIATIKTDFPTKFGVPRQSGLIKGLRGRIVFEPEYRDPEALRGLEGFSHIWLLWDFSEARKASPKSSPEGKDLKKLWRPTVRPPRLGGNKRVGVFATRSPFRPNNIGLSSVRVLSIDLHTSDGPVIEVEGIDMMDGTPIFDIKPYLAFTDSHPDATGSLTGPTPSPSLVGRGVVSFSAGKLSAPLPTREGLGVGLVSLSPSLIAAFDAEHLEALREILASDPRPHYQDDPDRVYAFEFAGKEVKFRVKPDQIEAWTE
ncbi:MAG: tRNA (N6-threonylcarbamoyladenosine(37)-N6)-methyltransferase TrmO [Bacteroidaceae bacterium]|nr:tRNA (N6-threonylcarbamoyladenosine(37)-N6)-methyltransferase TrmO [Bacteroidaceae bacterium]